MSTANVVTEPVANPLSLLPRVATIAGATPGTASPRERLAMERVLPVAIDVVAAVAACLVLGANALVVAPAWVLVMVVTRGYAPSLGRSRAEDLRRLGHAGIGLLLAGATVSWVLGLPTAAGELLALVATVTGLATGARLGLAGLLAHRGSRRAGADHGVVVVGHHDQVCEAIAAFRRTSSHGLEVVGACVHGPQEAAALPVPAVAGLDDVAGTAQAFGARAVVVLPCKHIDAAALRRLGWQLEAGNTQLLVAPALPDVSRHRASITTVGSIPMVHLRRAELTGWRRVVKEVAERAAALFVLLLASPLLLALMVAIRLDTPGPSIFRQTRVGRHDRPFTMLKLRTMTVTAEARRVELASANQAGGVLFKIRDDPRITRLGGFLRRYSLDELPQLVNVVRGDMALVGPRPPLPAEVERYPDDVRRRLVVKPGLTGLWQVSGRSDLAWDEAVRLDLSYVDNWSLGLDASIVLRTVRAVLSHEGAY